ncbi:hypothetical protein EUX98_g6977 [Antrodiella citrinella]|uniref:Uncharacterized protein n=1 Tax=Antrodiella citrinella TaxID=2447956 RepID=A0A4S4MNH8_9APHY|nr:hypothetical protein EUX98_g6977 [Antrodiella citrinella]
MSLHSQRHIPVSNYSSLSGAAPPIFQAPRAVLPANRVLLPQPTWTPNGFSKVDCAARSSQHITFDMVGAPAGFGTSVMDIAARGNMSNWIQRADDLLGLNTDKVSLRIVWPGYEHIDFNRSIPVNPQMNRGQLALQIAKLIMAYMSKMSSESPNPAGAKWRIGAGNVGLEHIYLASVFSVHANTFQAVLHLQFRHVQLTIKCLQIEMIKPEVVLFVLQDRIWKADGTLRRKSTVGEVRLHVSHDALGSSC